MQGLLLFLLQRGTGRRALLRSGILGLLWAIAPAVVWSTMGTWPLQKPRSPLSIANVILLGVPLLLDLAVLLCPRELWDRRRAAYIVAAVQLPMNAMLVICCLQPISKHPTDTQETTSGTIAFGVYMLVTLLTPLGYFYALIIDTHFWTGHNTEPTSATESSPLLAGPLSLSAASSLTEAQSRTKVPKISYDALDLSQRLGRGGTAVVFQATWKFKPVAVKQLAAMDMSADTMQRFLNEADILHRLKHRNVVMLHGVCVQPPLLCLVLELCDTGLRHYIDQHFQPPSDSTAPVTVLPAQLCILRDAAAGLAYVHSEGLVHGDIKADNFLVVHSGDTIVTKLADLELAVRTTGKQESVTADCPHWIAPELLAALQPALTVASDVYALGIVFYEVLSGQFPFHDRPVKGVAWRDALIEDIITGVRPTLPATNMPWLEETINSMWQSQARKRPLAKEVETLLLSRLMTETPAFVDDTTVLTVN